MTTRIERTAPTWPATGKLSTAPVRNDATRVTVSAFGVLAGLAGIEHGIGEVLQGNEAPAGLVIESWPESEAFRLLDGEPAMTLIPNLLATGILAIIASVIFLVWATMFIERKNGAFVLMLLSVVMLLVGGGFGPPLLGIIVGAAATRINAPLTWWRAHLPRGARRLLGMLWPWSLAASILTWLLLMPGSILVDYSIGVPNPDDTIAVLTFTAFGSLLLAIFTACAHDIERQVDSYEASAMSG